MNRGDEPSKGKARVNAVAMKGLVKVAIFMLILVAALFLSAGTLDWVMAWVYIGLVVVNSITVSLMMDPELLAERAQPKENYKKWDLAIVIFMARVGPLLTMIVAGLNVRFAWSPQIRLGPQIAALVVLVLGLLLTDWAVVANKFFSGVVRIQEDRGHAVITGGPYRFVRHPGYAGSVLAILATPLMLSSLWALIPGGLTVVITVVRTALEDRTLQDELDGYRDYAHQVRHRLLPGIW